MMLSRIYIPENKTYTNNGRKCFLKKNAVLVLKPITKKTTAAIRCNYVFLDKANPDYFLFKKLNTIIVTKLEFNNETIIYVLWWSRQNSETS